MADTAKFFILDLDQSPVPEGSLRDPAYRRRLRDTQHERWRTATPGEARVITRMLRQRKQDPNAGQRPQAASPRARERRDGSKRNHSRGSPSDDPDLSDPAPRTCLYGPTRRSATPHGRGRPESGPQEHGVARRRRSRVRQP